MFRLSRWTDGTLHTHLGQEGGGGGGGEGRYSANHSLTAFERISHSCHCLLRVILDVTVRLALWRLVRERGSAGRRYSKLTSNPRSQVGSPAALQNSDLNELRKIPHITFGKMCNLPPLGKLSHREVVRGFCLAEVVLFSL